MLYYHGSNGSSSIREVFYALYASQKEFDNRLNEYIKYLPHVDWEITIVNKFNDIISSKVFDQSFDPLKWKADQVITDVQHLKKQESEEDIPQNIISVEHIDESAVCQNI